MANWKEREADKYTHDKWYENLWYHYKFHIIVGAVLIAIAVSLIYSVNLKDPVDMYIMYITESPEVYVEKTDALKNVLTEFAVDSNDDGKVNIYVENIYIGNEFDAANVYQNKNKIMTAIRSGDCMLVIAENYGADYLVESGACDDLASKYPDVTSGSFAYDGKMWNWTGSDFFETNKELKRAFGTLDLYFSTRVFQGTIAELRDDAKLNYALAEDMLEAIMTNTKPE